MFSYSRLYTSLLLSDVWHSPVGGDGVKKLEYRLAQLYKRKRRYICLYILYMQGYLFKRGVVLIYIYEIYYTDNSLKNIYTSSFSQGVFPFF